MPCDRTAPERRELLQRAAGLGLLSLAALPMGVQATGVASSADPRGDGRPPEVRRWSADARLQGEIRFRYWGFHVYDAQLWVRPDFDAQRPLEHPLALSLIYARELKARDIAERSVEEIERQTAVTPEQARAWMAHMERAFVDIRPGDRLTGVFRPQDGAASFFFNGRPTAEVRDAVFAPLFFGIWLSPRTSEPGMRRALLRLDRGGADRGGLARGS